MDMARSRSQNYRFLKALMLRKQKGQGMIEYILLFAVSMSFVFLVFQSDNFKNTFGTQGLFSQIFARKIACNYRYGDSLFQDRGCNLDNRDYQSRVHLLYFPTGSETRFFGPRSTYPSP